MSQRKIFSFIALCAFHAHAATDTGYFRTLLNKFFKKPDPQALRKQDIDVLRDNLLHYIQQEHPSQKTKDYSQKAKTLEADRMKLEAQLHPTFGKKPNVDREKDLQQKLEIIKKQREENSLSSTMVEMRDKFFASIISSIATQFTDEWYKKYQVSSLQNMQNFQPFFDGVVKEFKDFVSTNSFLEIKEEFRSKATTNYFGQELKGASGKFIAIENVWNARAQRLNELSKTKFGKEKKAVQQEKQPEITQTSNQRSGFSQKRGEDNVEETLPLNVEITQEEVVQPQEVAKQVQIVQSQSEKIGGDSNKQTKAEVQQKSIHDRLYKTATKSSELKKVQKN